jgi:hypothetical protein
MNQLNYKLTTAEKQDPKLRREATGDSAVQMDSIDLRTINEALLLDLFRLLHHLRFPHEDPIKSMALTCGCSPNTLRAALENRSYIGVLSWLRLEHKIGTNIFEQWYNLQRNAK